jgi:class 3 adenylate cyclase
LEALRRSAPQDLTRRILAERDHLEGERKLVTALFTDIVGSTELAESMDPEDWRDIVSGAHRCVSQAVYQYEGTIAQLLGDGVLAFFGAPLAHEDDAERALRAALEILASVQRYAAELRASRRVSDFQMRIGLNTGMVVVGNIGSDLHMEYLAIGDTINLAARMQTAAAPNTILVTENTHRQVSSLFDFEDGGKIHVKGKSDSVQVYRVSGERKGAIRIRGIAGLSSPMVGREREFASLLQTIAGLREGRGSIVTIAGEAGLGKSRLVAEWRKAVNRQPDVPAVRWVEGRCLSYGSTIAYHLGSDLLRNILGTAPDASEETVRSALHRIAAEHFPDGDSANEVYTFLGHILGLHLEEEAAARVRYLDGPALLARYVQAYRALLRKLAESQPLVVVCEDIHWADPSSVELGGQVVPVAAEAPIAFVFVARPDRDAVGWRLVNEAREIPGLGAAELHLSPLTEQDSQQLVSNLLEVADLPARVRELILAKAEGNPFYVEEVIRMLIDRGDLVRQDGRWAMARDLENIEIPDTLQGVIMARIDRLPEDAKRTLQIAAVIGRRFQVRVLEMVLQQQGL